MSLMSSHKISTSHRIINVFKSSANPNPTLTNEHIMVLVESECLANSTAKLNHYLSSKIQILLDQDNLRTMLIHWMKVSGINSVDDFSENVNVESNQENKDKSSFQEIMETFIDFVEDYFLKVNDTLIYCREQKMVLNRKILPTLVTIFVINLLKGCITE